MNRRIALAWTVLLAGFIFNTGAYALTVVGLQQGFVELNPVMAGLFGLWGFFGAYLFVVFTYFAISKAFARLAFVACFLQRPKPVGRRIFFVPVFAFSFYSFDFFNNLLLLAGEGGI